MKYPISIKTSLKMNFKPNKHESYLFNRQIEKEKRSNIEKSEGENFEFN